MYILWVNCTYSLFGSSSPAGRKAAFFEVEAAKKEGGCARLCVYVRVRVCAHTRTRVHLVGELHVLGASLILSCKGKNELRKMRGG